MLIFAAFTQIESCLLEGLGMLDC